MYTQLIHVLSAKHLAANTFCVPTVHGHELGEKGIQICRTGMLLALDQNIQ